MKKFVTVALIAAMTACFAVGCTSKSSSSAASSSSTADSSAADSSASDSSAADSSASDSSAADSSASDDVAVMSYADYVAAELNSAVCVETYIQAKQSWWDNKATFYTQNNEGAYFIYEMPCTQEEYDSLVTGTKIRVEGYKSEWSGEIEITDAKFTIIEDDTLIVTAEDVTSLLGTDELINKQNQFVCFKDMTVKSVSFKNDEPGDDIYVTFTKDGADYDFCLEYYLNGNDEQLYETVSNLKEGDVVSVDAFLYWYNGANPHITNVIVGEAE